MLKANEIIKSDNNNNNLSKLILNARNRIFGVHLFNINILY